MTEAFACLEHEILLAKLNFCGIQGVAADWLRSYLTNSRQKVEIKSPDATQNFFCDWGTLKHGVPKSQF